jgi:hypothetical protein
VSSILIIYSRLQPFYARWIFLPRFLILEILTPNLVSKVSNYFNNTNDSKLLINKNKNRGKHLFSPDTIVTHTIVPFWGDRESICKFALINYCVSGSGSITAPCAQLLEVGCISIRGPISIRDAFLSGIQLLSGDTFIKDWDWGLGVANNMGFLQFLIYGSRSSIAAGSMAQILFHLRSGWN